ncbi:hypothetical protein UFOVP539_24 [uncultured Caudovirales phage]|uniref:Uncharacterized protein n=1 Tax=uncultured Caudovirales phage TaxID=2100421 RepID=A0A6J5MRD6_9CAUD|nr:hypothetical protein UFOVP539_24 [uncultured Caudovirales phage]
MPTELVGGIALRKALNQYAPDLAKELTKELGAILKPIVAQAKGYVPAESPMSGWAERATDGGHKFPKYDASEIRKGIVYKTTPSQVNRQGFKNLIRIQNKSMIGAIYETAGRKNGQGQDWVGTKAGGASKGVSRSVNPYAGNQFISNLGNLYGSGKKDSKMMGRLIFRAWANTQGKANAKVFKAIENTTARFNTRTQIVDVKRAA